MLSCGFFLTAGMSRVFMCGELLEADVEIRRTRVNAKQSFQQATLSAVFSAAHGFLSTER